MVKMLKLINIMIALNKIHYVVAVVFLGSFVGIISATSPVTISNLGWILNEEGLEALFIKWLCSIVNSPLAFLYVLLPVIGLKCFSSMQRGSSVIITLPIKRKDLLQSLYLVALISAATSATIAAAINTIITYSTSGLALDLRYYYIMFLTYIVTFIPTILYVTSLGMVLYSITPLKSEIPVLISVVYLMIVPLLRILAMLTTGGEEAVLH